MFRYDSNRIAHLSLLNSSLFFDGGVDDQISKRLVVI